KNYVVGATGDLQSPEEIEWLNEKARQTAQIKEFDQTDHRIPDSDTALKTIRYTQNNIHDFAWFADKRFHVLKGEREMPQTGKKVTCRAMFLNKEADLWQRSIEYIGDALYYFSLWYGDYPYNHCTAVHSSISAGGGMEYPNITVIGNSGKDLPLEMVIMHEVGHNWFYSILGFNEREHPWMDEGINSFSEARYMKEKYQGNDKLYKMALNEKQAKLLNIDQLPYKAMHRFSYLMTARYNIDQAADLHSTDYTPSNYGQITYHKTSLIFDHLHAYLGEEKFNSIMQDFYDEWKFKHPYPEDLRKAFEDGSGKDLSWLFDDLLGTTKKLDYRITGLRKNQLKVKNTGKISAPFSVTAIKGKNKIFTQWYDGFDGKKTFTLPENNGFDYLKIDPDYRMPELYTYNNYIRKKGLFRKTEPIHFQLAGIIENTDYTNLYFLPAMGWNQYNNFMLGMLFYNSFIPRSKFEYQLIPMYGFGNNNLAGYANLEYHILPYQSAFREITLGLSGKRYAFSQASDDNFHQLKAKINFHLKKSNPKSKIKNNIILSGTLADDVNDIMLGNNPDLLTFINLDFMHRNNKFNPYSLNASAQYNKDFAKTNAEFNYQWKYKRNKLIAARLFAGAFLFTSDSYTPTYNYGLSSISGTGDYTYDHLFLGRFEDPAGANFLGKQYVPSDGGFSIYAPHFTTSDWIVSFNTTAAIPYLPGILDFHLYGNLATFGNPHNFLNYDNSASFAWECGIQYQFAGESLVISLPLIMSNQLKEYSDDVYGQFYERIRFSLDLSILNVFDLYERFLP
ncbi:MAG: M1 family aminopeptidase, partial [Bacteroidales bacterium]